MTDDELDALLAVHDDLLARRGVEIWVGAEPTFTRADSIAPAWTSTAEGDDKLPRAETLATQLARAFDASSMRVLGRQYPDEPAPRFAFALRWGTESPPAAPPKRSSSPSIPPIATAPTPAPAFPLPPAPSDLATDHLLTITADPGVVEVNMAPSPTAAAFAVQARAIYRAAAASSLSPTRRRWNGDLADSGGGGQITLGGRTPTTSPFLRYPHVLPAVIRYVNNHPSLSYWFASECVGSASQGPRPDEGTREHFDELGVALRWLEQLADRGELAPDQLGAALAPLLVDSAGNSHRAELNVEKLWNGHLATHGPRHGRMGVVEWRAIRMPERPAMLAALVVLLRSIVARCVVADYRAPLVDWHDELHDRWALPAALARDLRFVLGDLDEHGVGVPAQLRAELDAWRAPGITCRLGDATLELRPALEFWPLVGDVASQERAGARWVDASTQRWEISIDGPGPDRVVVAGKWATLRSLGDHARAVGVRRRVFAPSPGLHPGLPVTDPLVVSWAWGGRAQTIELWAWRPTGGAYPGLPVDGDDALLRRNERVRIVTRDGEVTAAGNWVETRPFTVDLRLG